MPNMGQFAGQAQQQFAGPGPAADPMGGDPSTFAAAALNEIADKLGKMAQVILQVRPELAPLVQKMAEAGSMLQQQLTAAPQETGAGTPTQPEGPQDVSMA
jgi:hypothetical protein